VKSKWQSIINKVCYMSQYLLLRDNKQTGPYSLEELLAKGLKPYDLVWLNGKSAAWRYPSEIAELKPYAPAVEEQPYDRFYKKPAARKEAMAVAETTTLPVAAIETPAPATKIITPKKIYVTMPAANGQGAARAVTFQEEKPAYAEQQPVQTPVAEAIPPVAPQTNGHKAYQPKAIDEPVQKQEAAAIPATVQDTLKTGSFAEQVATDYYSQYEEKIPAIPFSPSRRNRRNIHGGKLVMQGLVAACLILGGIVIGLLISNRELKQQQDLDNIVKQIQEREKAKQASLVNNTVSTITDQQISPVDPQAATGTVSPSPASGIPAAAVHGADKKLPAVKKETPPVAGTVEPTDNTKQNVSIASAVMTAVPEKEKPAPPPAAIESARKNIYQMVAVEGSKYKTGVLGGISDLRLTISNNSPYPIDQVAVEIKYLGMEKKMVKTQTIIFNDIPPGEQKTLEAPRTSRGISVDYAITRINSKILGLAQAGL
jgi:hypothetical protein